MNIDKSFYLNDFNHTKSVKNTDLDYARNRNKESDNPNFTKFDKFARNIHVGKNIVNYSRNKRIELGS